MGMIFGEEVGVENVEVGWDVVWSGEGAVKLGCYWGGTFVLGRLI
jgi:hypothetical protein